MVWRSASENRRRRHRCGPRQRSHVGHRAGSSSRPDRRGASGSRIRRRHGPGEGHPPSSALHRSQAGAERVHLCFEPHRRFVKGESSVKQAKRVALAYSGGLDTSIIIPWLKENYGCEVIAVAVDVGQAEETSGLAEKAHKTGAAGFHLVDAKEEFAADYLFPVLKAGAIYEKDYLLGTSTARPLIARKQVEIALQTGCDALAHGCTGKGNDQVRFELAYQALAPELQIIAPWREWNIVSREDAIDYANERGIPVPVTKKDPYSRDRNLWHLSHEGGPLEDPSFEPEASMFKLTVDPSIAPDEAEKVAITFQSGIPVAVNGKAYSAARLVETLNKIGGRHGVGRADIVENRLIGIKSR